MTDWLVGLLGSAAIAGAAYAKRSLTASGAAAAIVVGTVMYAAGSLVWFGTLIAFFVSSSLLSSWKRREKAPLEEAYEKTGRRDGGQVWANGGAGALLCVLHAVWPHSLWWYAFLGAMAAVNADTWATEIGSLSRTPPRSIATWRPVPPGASGGVSALGLSAATAGALFVGAAALLLAQVRHEGLQGAAGWMWLAAAWAGGMAGALADSWLGATLQCVRRCAVCGREVERAVHCGRATEPHRGLAWLNNDAVNAIASLVGAAVAALLAAGLVLP